MAGRGRGGPWGLGWEAQHEQSCGITMGMAVGRWPGSVGAAAAADIYQVLLGQASCEGFIPYFMLVTPLWNRCGVVSRAGVDEEHVVQVSLRVSRLSAASGAGMGRSGLASTGSGESWRLLGEEMVSEDLPRASRFSG